VVQSSRAYVVRRATEDDADRVRAVGLATWPSTYAFAGEDFVEHGLAAWWSREAVARGISDTVTLVAETEEGVVGMGNLDLRRDPAVIWKLYVRPEAQGTGVGSALMDALLGALPPDRDTVTIEYMDGNDRAGAFYAPGVRGDGPLPQRDRGLPRPDLGDLGARVVGTRVTSPAVVGCGPEREMLMTVGTWLRYVPTLPFGCDFA
jgi:ribosomal protein S18 acetylase RimI-like enzyme